MMKIDQARDSELASGCPEEIQARYRRAQFRKPGSAGAITALTLSLLLAAGAASANEEIPMRYPETKRVEIVDEQFGARVADPYRWLEKDMRRDADVAAWVDARNGIARSYLANLPGRNIFRERLTALFDHERLTAPHKKGDRYFFTRNAGLDGQPVLVMRASVDGPDRVLIDPNTWSEDGATAVAEWSASEDGMHVAFAMQDSGTDWRTIRVLDVESGQILDDEVAWARFTKIAWAKDGSGFFYSRFPEPEEGAAFDAPISGHAVYFHALGTPQSQDRLLYSTPKQPHLMHIASVTEDGRFAHIYSSPGSGGSAPTVVDLTRPEWTPRTLVANFDNYWTVAGNIGTRLLLTTTDDLGVSPMVQLFDVSREMLFTVVGLGFGCTTAATVETGTHYAGTSYVPIHDFRLPFNAVWSPENDNPALRRFLSEARTLSREWPDDPPPTSV